jgi:hypothetical protein
MPSDGIVFLSSKHRHRSPTDPVIIVQCQSHLEESRQQSLEPDAMSSGSRSDSVASFNSAVQDEGEPELIMKASRSLRKDSKR